MLNFLRFVMSGERAIRGDLPYDRDRVATAFLEKGVKVVSCHVDVDAYRAFLAAGHYEDGAYSGCFYEKSLEHFLSFQFSTLDSRSLVVDVANAGSCFPQIIHDSFGCRVISNDLNFPSGRKDLTSWHTRIGCNAASLPIESGTVDLITVHCALEMFEGNDDINLVREASRVLKYGGKLVIIPLYMNETYHVLRDPENPRRKQPTIDDGAQLVYRRDFYRVAFARFYSVGAFSARLLEICGEQLDFTLFRILNTAEIGSDIYLHWVGVFEKKVEVRHGE